jgi:C4-dicarboxylate transporter DctM subunit
MLSFSMVVFLLIGILFMGLPVAFSLGGTSLLLIALFDLPMKIVGATIFTSLDSFTILSIPLFVLMSQILLDGRIGDDLFDVMNAWVRHLPEGLPSPPSLHAPSLPPSRVPGPPRRPP